MKHIYWVGIKESEIKVCKHLFEGSVTFIGSGKDGNISFSSSQNYTINYNEDSIELDNFMKNTLRSVIKKIPDVLFFCYTTSYIYSLEDEKINKHIICGNSRDTLQLLRNKMNSRLWLNKYVPVLPTIILSGNECQYHYLCSLFPSEMAFTIQGCTGAGGIDTYIMSLDNYDKIRERLYKNHIYLISPYKAKSYSTNIHVLFTEKEYYISPGSIQIVEYENGRMIYRGSDFIEYQNISSEIIKKIIDNTKILAEKIKVMSYTGILGIDYLISGTEIYFLEINPRFQSSTPMINLALTEKGLPSIQEVMLKMFFQKSEMPDNIFDGLKVNHSSYIVDYEKGKCDYSVYLQNIIHSNEIEELVLDGYYDGMKCQTGASIFSITFNKNITSLNSNNSFNIYDNIKPFPLKTIDLCSCKDCKWLKFSIMNQGVCLSDIVKEQLPLFQKGVYSSLDIYLSDRFIVNAPIQMPFHSLSPFKIDYIENRLMLFYGDEFISNISICEKNAYSNQCTKKGVNFQRISFIATDRLRIHHSPTCVFQTQKKGCKFCDVPGQSMYFDEDDINEVIDWHLKHSNFRHILIGGASGTYPQEYVRILKIVKYIRSKSDKPIYLMTLPPKENSILDEYYAAGVNEVAFNIEIYDRDAAKKIMPGKGQISLSTYQSALLHSVELWKNTGKVRSLLVYGLENDATFFEGIEWLASNGIQPIISPFRALNGTVYSDTVPPSTQKLIEIYDTASKICQKYHIELGPDCMYCQNNTLSFDSRVVFLFDKKN